jgi:hypothetical protein
MNKEKTACDIIDKVFDFLYSQHNGFDEWWDNLGQPIELEDKCIEIVEIVLDESN